MQPGQTMAQNSSSQQLHLFGWRTRSQKGRGNAARRRTPAHYHALAGRRNAWWLGPEVPNANTRTCWACRSCGHEWRAIYNSLQRGTGCPVCGIARRARTQSRKPDEYRALAGERGLVWHGPPVRNISPKTGWECPQGHRWLASFGKIHWGRGCPTCARHQHAERSRANRHGPEEYRHLAEANGFRWRGPQVTSANAKTLWECGAGHRWRASYHKIASGRRCPVCAPRARAEKLCHPPEAYHELAAERGFEWLGQEVGSVAVRTGWRCPKGHEWESCYNSVRQGSGCHTCSDRLNGALVSRAQRQLCTVLGGTLNVAVGRYRVDVALTLGEVRVAVEYDCWYWHGGREGEDAARDEALTAVGWRVLRIRSARELPTRAELDRALRLVAEGQEKVVVTLPDWGVGPVRHDRGRSSR